MAVNITTASMAVASSEDIERKLQKSKASQSPASAGFNAALAQAIDKEEAGVIAETAQNDKAVEELLDKVFLLGEDLKKNHTLSKLGEYRSSIRQFFNFVLDNAYENREVSGYLNRRTMIQKKYSVVRTVDEKLDKLARAVLNEQQEVLAILTQVEEINGLLINFWR